MKCVAGVDGRTLLKQAPLRHRSCVGGGRADVQRVGDIRAVSK